MNMISTEAIKKYVQRRSEDLVACKQAIESRDYAVIENIGHKMKGNGLTFGYPELADIGKDLEGAAVEKDIDLIRNKVQSFEKWFDEKKDPGSEDTQTEQ